MKPADSLVPRPDSKEPAQESVMICRSSTSWIVLGLTALAVNLFILFVLIPGIGSHISWDYGTNLYADGYDQIASNLAEGNGYRFYPDTAETLMREPGYPILLAGIFLAFGKEFAAVKLANLVLAFATAYLMTLMARELTTSRLVIFGAPLLFLFHPGTLIAESRGGVEVLFAFMLTLFLLSVSSALKKNRWWNYLVAGGVLGFTLLVRSTLILFPFVLLGYFLLFDQQGNRKLAILRNFAVMILAMFLVLSPWIIRNYSLTRKFVPTASVLGIAAHAGFYLSSHHAVGNLQLDWDAARERDQIARELRYHFRSGYYQYFYSSSDELSFSNYLFNQVVRGYKQSPLLFFGTVMANFFKFWCGGKSSASVALNAAVQLPFLALTIVGMIICMRNGLTRKIAPMVLLMFYIVGVSLPILAQARYSEPLTPFLSILACAAVATAYRRYHGSGYELHRATVQGLDFLKKPSSKELGLKSPGEVRRSL